MLVSCPWTRRSQIGGILPTSVRESTVEVKYVCMLTSFAVTMFLFGIVVIEVWETQLPVWAFVLALLICASARLS